ncbi:hypothetical protein HOV93_21720 [Planctomycetes bacterium FF15]|uniref:Uncharacterized protein n=1 Tax=Bremerella alba TaxID=980252 RepID=A0A7V8V4W4_9BACT|nr:hypothetical protein [Bremerella alba]
MRRTTDRGNGERLAAFIGRPRGVVAGNLCDGERALLIFVNREAIIRRRRRGVDFAYRDGDRRRIRATGRAVVDRVRERFCSVEIGQRCIGDLVPYDRDRSPLRTRTDALNGKRFTCIRIDRVVGQYFQQVRRGIFRDGVTIVRGRGRIVDGSYGEVNGRGGALRVGNAVGRAVVGGGVCEAIGTDVVCIRRICDGAIRV